MAQVPTIAFDASRHVVQGRDAKSGQIAFFSLSSISEAERVLENAPQVPTQDTALTDEVARLAAMVSSLQGNDSSALLRDMAAAISALSQRVEAAERRVGEVTNDMVQAFSRLGGVK